ncbi:MAG: hypothetical protein K0S65_3183 [Labilithrix sp.]|nr:hypothetical protein [Labilithrix sp.]
MPFAGPLRQHTAILAVAASAIAFGVFESMQLVDKGPPPVAATREIRPPSQPMPTATESRASRPTEKQAPETPTIDVHSLPGPKTLPGIRQANPDIAKSVTPEDSEGALLHRAHAAMIAIEPAQALQLTAEHLRRFPNGVLAQEREVIAIEALARLGRADEAQSHATTFFLTYPRSPYRSRVDDALASKPSSAGTP